MMTKSEVVLRVVFDDSVGEEHEGLTQAFLDDLEIYSAPAGQHIGEVRVTAWPRGMDGLMRTIVEMEARAMRKAGHEPREFGLPSLEVPPAVGSGIVEEGLTNILGSDDFNAAAWEKQDPRKPRIDRIIDAIEDGIHVRDPSGTCKCLDIVGEELDAERDEGREECAAMFDHEAAEQRKAAEIYFHSPTKGMDRLGIPFEKLAMQFEKLAARMRGLGER